jgi:hypothetical protein
MYLDRLFGFVTIYIFNCFMRGKKIQKQPKGKRGRQSNDVQSASDKEEDHEKPHSPLVVEPETKEKGKRGASKAKESKESKQKDHELFSDEFNKRIEFFKDFYRDYLKLKGGRSDVDQTAEFNRACGDVRKKIESACLEAMRKELEDVT